MPKNNQSINRNQIIYFLLFIVIIISGLASRNYSKMLPNWVDLYLGDALWALIVFVLIGMILKHKSSLTIVLLALSFSYIIEISQLYHAPWIDKVRSTWLGGHILGFGFLWSDLLCYTVGIAAGFLVEKLVLNRRSYRTT
jgi:hypothetical protein